MSRIDAPDGCPEAPPLCHLRALSSTCHRAGCWTRWPGTQERAKRDEHRKQHCGHWSAGETIAAVQTFARHEDPAGWGCAAIASTPTSLTEPASLRLSAVK
jgi:hypothetical protein